MDDVQKDENNPDQATSLSRLQRLKRSISPRAAKVERAFLSVLRYSTLVTAGLVLVSAAITLSYGAFQQFGRTEVEPDPVSLAAGDIAPEPSAAPAKKAAAVISKPRVSAEVRRQTLDVYRVGFKGF